MIKNYCASHQTRPVKLADCCGWAFVSISLCGYNKRRGISDNAPSTGCNVGKPVRRQSLNVSKLKILATAFSSMMRCNAFSDVSLRPLKYATASAEEGSIPSFDKLD